MTREFDHSLVAGAGSWGTALALLLASKGKKVTLFTPKEDLKWRFKEGVDLDSFRALLQSAVDEFGDLKSSSLFFGKRWVKFSPKIDKSGYFFCEYSLSPLSQKLFWSAVGGREKFEAVMGVGELPRF